MAQLLILARLFASAIGADQEAIVCWYEPPTQAEVCFVDVSDTGYAVGGVEFRQESNGKVSLLVNSWEY